MTTMKLKSTVHDLSSFLTHRSYLSLSMVYTNKLKLKVEYIGLLTDSDNTD